MREKTKKELTKLAEVIVDKFKIDMIIGSSDFLLVALDEAEKLELDLNWQTIKKNEVWLTQKVKYLDADQKG
jgi:hypothetical protein